MSPFGSPPCTSAGEGAPLRTAVAPDMHSRFCNPPQRRHAKLRAVIGVGLVVGAIAGCSAAESLGPGTKKDGVTIVEGSNIIDTIDARLERRLMVTLLDRNGKRVSGATVRFSAVGGEVSGLVCVVATEPCTPSGTTVTNDRGEARAQVQLGTKAGDMSIVAFADGFPAEDTARYTVRAGNVARVVASAGDVVLDVGASVVLSARTCDRYCNPRTELPTLNAGVGSAVSIDTASRTVRGIDMGTQKVYARFGSAADSIFVRVIPEGRLVAFDNSARPAMYLFNLNGTQFQAAFSWPLGTTIAYIPRANRALNRLTVTTGSTLAFSVIDSSGTTIRTVVHPAPLANVIVSRILADGSVMYVARESRSGPANWPAVFRSDRDGNVTKLMDLPQIASFIAGADFSPDGLRLAYIALAPVGLFEMRVVDLTSAASVTLLPDVTDPTFSPDGRRIAYYSQSSPPSVVGRRLGVIDVDGSNNRIVSASPIYVGTIAWSGDGTKVLARTGATGDLGVVRISDGASVTLSLRSIPVEARLARPVEWW